MRTIPQLSALNGKLAKVKSRHLRARLAAKTGHLRVFTSQNRLVLFLYQNWLAGCRHTNSVIAIGDAIIFGTDQTFAAVE